MRNWKLWLNLNLNFSWSTEGNKVGFALRLATIEFASTMFLWFPTYQKVMSDTESEIWLSEFSQTLQTTMAAASPVAEEILDLKRNGRAERVQWVLNAPEPPRLWQQLMGSIREAAFPCRNNFPSLKRRPTTHAISVLQTIFPILQWCRNYKATKFKKDLMAGLTLASLSIPQVISICSI